MARTAYASLVSLLNTLDQIHTHPLVSTFFDMNQTKSLSEKVNFFIDFVEKYSDADSREVEDLVHRIADAAHEAENIVEVHAADRIRGGETPSFLHDLQKIMEKMKSMKEEVIKVKEKIGKSRSFLLDLTPSSSSLAAPPATAEATTVGGFDEYKHILLYDLTGLCVELSVISITGTGGIGKTTLARELYENSHVVHHFDVRVWVTVSQEYSLKKLLLQALSCLGGGSIDMDRADDEQLSVQLYKTLFSRRYLIVLDDVWTAEIWDMIKLHIPENNNGSKIVVTTRKLQLAHHFRSSSVFTVKFLDDENSWKLFCEKTFPHEDFPSELKELGKKIVRKCGGLPLAISVIGLFLAKSPRTHEYWEKIVQDKSLILNLEENSPLSMLYLIYKYLPVCLKSCFLYLGLYLEHSRIDVSQLIKIWVAEGFIKANRGQSLEEVAESYSNDLVDRNLLLLSSPSISKEKRCYTHNLVRELCIMLGEKEKFICIQRSIDGSHHFIADWRTTSYYLKFTRTSSLYTLMVPVPCKTRLLRVLCCDDGNLHYASKEVNMRFLRVSSRSPYHLLPSLMLSQFWSLQTLIASGSQLVIALAEIWKMPQIRHIDVEMISLLDTPPPSDDDVYVLENLQTLKTVQNLIFTEEVCKRIPNIKELGISCDYSLQNGACPSYHLENLGCFDKLELLHYYCKYVGDSLQNINFPTSLKELTLNGCKLKWSYMAVIASLPHLESLYLNEDAVVGTEWVFDDERFVSLKHLSIHECYYVTKWIAESFNFPILEELSIWNLKQLEEIPLGMGEIPALQSINLHYCSESTYISAVEILHKHESFGNPGLRVAIKCDEPGLLVEKVKELGLTCGNLWINS